MEDWLSQRATKKPVFEGHGDVAGDWLQQRSGGPKAPVYRDIYDVTIGAAELGATESARLLAQGLPRAISNSEPVVAFARTMSKFKDNHPEYSPVEVDSASELLQSPMALSSRIFAGAPQMAAGLGTIAIPYVGLPLAAGMSWSIEGRRAYETAIAKGQDEDTATSAGRSAGAVAAIFDVLMAKRILQIGKGEQGYIARKVAASAERLMKGSGFVAEYASAAAHNATLSVLQGGINEGILSLYGVPIEEGFIDRRMQDAVGAAATSVAFGMTQQAFRKMLPTAEGGQAPGPKIDVWDRDTMFKYLVGKQGMEPEHAAPMAEIVDAYARQWSASTGEAPEKWYASKVNEKTTSGDAIAAKMHRVPGIFFDKDPAKAIKNFLVSITDEIAAPDREILKNYNVNDKNIHEVFGKYLTDGLAPAPELIDPFETFKQTLKDAWLTTKGTVPTHITPELRGVFDRLLSVDTDQIAAARKKLGEAVTTHGQLEEYDKKGVLNPGKDVATVDPEKGVVIKHEKGDLEASSDFIKEMAETVQQLQLGRAMPDRDSSVARRAASAGTVREILRSETPGERVVRNGFQRAILDPMSKWIDFSAPLKHWSTGRAALSMLSDVLGHQHKIQGQFEEENVRAYLDLSWKDRKWLKEVDEAEAARTGLRLDNFTRFIEAVGVPNPIQKAPSETLESYRGQVKKVMVELGRMAEMDGMTVKLPDNDVIPYKQPKELRMLRFLTDDARAAIERREGPVFDAIKAAIEKADPDMKLKGKTEDILSKYAEGTGIRESGPLTDARSIKFFPTEVEVNGTRIKVLHTDPYQYLRKAVRTQAYQIGWHRVMGDANLESAKTATMKKMVEQLGLMEPYNVETLKGRFAEKGLPLPAFADDLKSLEAMAKKLDIPTGPKRKNYVEALQKISAVDITKERELTLRNLAKELGGVDPKTSVASLLDEVRRRVIEQPVDAVDVLTKRLRAEGGDTKHLADVIKLSQGIPIYKLGGDFLERNPLLRGAKLLSGVIGGLQTSSSVIPNIPQTMVQVPHMVGLKNFMEAVHEVAFKRKEVQSAMIALGAIGDTHLAWGLERGYRIEGIARNISQAIQLGTGMKWVADLNNVIAGESFRRLAESWKANPKLSASDQAVARRLELSDAQIKAIKAGKMDDLTYSKIVQQGIAKTQFVTESAHNRGSLENNPLTKLIFAYNAYASGTARSTAEIMKSSYQGLKSGDTKTVLHTTVRLATWMGGALGAGAMSEMLRNVFRGDVSKEQQENVWEKAFGAALSVQLVGPSQRMLESLRYDKGQISNWITGLMPQVRAVADAVAVGINVAKAAGGGEPEYGRFAEFGAGRQVSEALKTHTPLAKAIFRWAENTAYPDKVTYDTARASAAKWQDEILGKKGSKREDPLNAEYHPIWEMAARGDIEGSMRAAQEYYVNYYAKMGENPEKRLMEGLSGDKARTGLRASLMKRAPLNMDTTNIVRFIDTLSPQKKQEYLVAQAKYMNIVNLVAPSND